MNIEHRTSNKETLSLTGKRGMDTFLKKIIGQDQPDRQDIAAFGRKPLAAGEKIPSIL